MFVFVSLRLLVLLVFVFDCVYYCLCECPATMSHNRISGLLAIRLICFCECFAAVSQQDQWSSCHAIN